MLFIILHILCSSILILILTKFNIICNECNGCFQDDTLHQLHRISTKCCYHTMKTYYHCWAGVLTFSISVYICIVYVFVSILCFVNDVWYCDATLYQWLWLYHRCIICSHCLYVGGWIQHGITLSRTRSIDGFAVIYWLNLTVTMKSMVLIMVMTTTI